MLRISAAVQHYDWGSPSAIPEFLGEAANGEPVAELWFGTHRLGMSLVEGTDGARPLSDVAGDLPFMLKVLAPAQPLSIQVHPDAVLAASGFVAEDGSGLDPGDPARDYKDPFHKPEMVYALTPFETLVGLRPIDEAVALLTPLDVPIAHALLSLSDVGPVGMIEFLLSSPPEPDAIHAFVAACAAQLEAGADVGRGYLTVVEAARLHPGDAGLVVALLMNRLTVAPGESTFIGPGLIHAHLSGLCLEVMTASDNVFRAGLTTKRINPQGVLDSLDAADGSDATIAPRAAGSATKVYEPDAGLFALAVTSGSEDRLPGSGHRILLCLAGDVELVAESGARIRLARGEAAFATADDGVLAARGTGTTALAYVP